MPLPALRHAWRSLRRTPVFTIAASLTLVIGLGAATTIFAVVNGVLLKPLPYGNPEQLIGAWHDMAPLNLEKATQTPATWLTYQRLARTIEGIGIYQESSVNLGESGGEREPQRVQAGWLSYEVIPVLRVTPLLGRAFTAEEDLPNGPNVVMISEGMWRSRFGADRGVVGRTMDVGGVSRQIVGVMPASFRFPFPETQLWLPLQPPRNGFGEGFSYDAVARLKPGVTVQEAQRDFTAVLPRILELYPEFVPGVTTKMLMEQAKPVPVLTAMRDDVVGGVSRTLWVVAAAAGLVLLVACANVTNLILVRADGRQRELAIREALGAGRARVLFHFLAESALLTALAAVVAFGVAWLAVRALVASPAQIPRLAEVRVDGAMALFTVAAAVLVALVCSVFPALRIGKAHLSKVLREAGARGGTAGRGQQRMRGALVAGQIALALVVLAGSGLLLRSFQQLNAVRPGFDPSNVATLWLSAPSSRYPGDTTLVRFYARLDERVAAIPGVQSAGLTSRLPLMSRAMSQNPFYPEDDASYANRIPPLQLYTTVDGDYFKAMGIPLLAGQVFQRLDAQRADEAVISRSTAIQFWKDSTGQRALGKRFRSLPGGPVYTVIGVVGDTRDSTLAKPPAQVTYFPEAIGGDTLFAQARRTMAIVVRTHPGVEPSSVVAGVQRAVRELDPSLPTFDVKPMSQVWAASIQQLRFTMLILGAAAAVTLVLGAIGLYGVMSYAVGLRTRELGVRIALGAQPGAVAAMMARQGLGLTVLGVAGGLAIFALVARFLRAFVYGVALADPVTLVGASLVLLAIAALASWVPARRASRVDPAETLRAE